MKKCGDCIHADICKQVNGSWFSPENIAYCEGFKDRTKYVEVVHGRWETANDGTHFCSNCGWDATYTWDDIDRSFINSADDVPDRITNYCPNCGARMDLEVMDNGQK